MNEGDNPVMVLAYEYTKGSVFLKMVIKLFYVVVYALNLPHLRAIKLAGWELPIANAINRFEYLQFSIVLNVIIYIRENDRHK